MPVIYVCLLPVLSRRENATRPRQQQQQRGVGNLYPFPPFSGRRATISTISAAIVKRSCRHRNDCLLTVCGNKLHLAAPGSELPQPARWGSRGTGISVAIVNNSLFALPVVCFGYTFFAGYVNKKGTHPLNAIHTTATDRPTLLEHSENEL